MMTIGFAFYRLYISIFFVLSNVIPSSPAMSLAVYDIYGVLLAALVFGCAFIKRMELVVSSAMAVIGSLCMALGAVIFSAGSGTVLWLFVVFSGFGVALMTVQWGYLLGCAGRKTVTLAVIAGFFLAAALNTGVGLFSSVYVAISVVVGPASAVLLIMTISRCDCRPQHSRELVGGVSNNERADVKYVVRASVAFFLFAVASVFCSVQLEFSVIGISDAPQYTLTLMRTYVTAIVCVIALVCLFIPRFSLKAMYRLIPLFLVIGGVSVFLQQFYPLWAYLCALVGRLGFQLIFWIFAPWIASRSKRPVANAFALEFAFYWLGYVGSLFIVGSFWPGRMLDAAGLMESLVVVSIVILLVTYLFIFSEHDLFCATHQRSIKKVGSAEPAEAVYPDIAQRYGLSPRETEVFYLLARGRDTSHIQKTLFISAGTVSSHRQRIYKKCGVHTKQELLDLVEREIMRVKVTP